MIITPENGRAEVEPLVRNFHGAQHKKFATFTEAKDWVGLNVSYQEIAAPSAGTTTTNRTVSSPTRPQPYQKSPRAAGSSSSKVLKETDVQDESGWDVVYTDGSCTGNGGNHAKAGIGVWWGHDDPRYVN